MPLPSRNYWRVNGTSGADAAMDLDHVVAAKEDPWLQYLYIAASDGSNTFAWTLERPAGTTILAGYGGILLDFGIDGFYVPGTVGDDLQLTVGGATGSITTRAFLVGVDKSRQ